MTDSPQVRETMLRSIQSSVKTIAEMAAVASDVELCRISDYLMSCIRDIEAERRKRQSETEPTDTGKEVEW